MTYQGPERRTTPSLQAELIAVALGLEKMANAVETNMSEARLQAIVAVEQRRDQRKIMISLVSAAVIIVVVSTIGVFQSRANHAQGQRQIRIGQDAAVVADYVRSCLETPTEKRDPVKCGSTAASSSAAVQGLIRFMDCAFLAQPATQAKLDACTVQAFQGGK